jgi:nitronate monooxygenase
MVHYSLAPLVAALRISMIACAGFANAAGLVTALTLGADGVLMGTRFMATQECPAHLGFKQWLAESAETDTIVTQRSIRTPSRNLKNGSVLEVRDMEGRGTTIEEMLPITSGPNSTKVYFEGDLEAGLVECGQVVGIINDIPTVIEIIDGIVSGARETIER